MIYSLVATEQIIILKQLFRIDISLKFLQMLTIIDSMRHISVHMFLDTLVYSKMQHKAVNAFFKSLIYGNIEETGERKCV